MYREETMKQSYVYILKCADNSYYTGVTSNLTQRLFQHESGYFPDSYTSTKLPIELVFYCEFTDINLAIETEKKIKKWSRAKKDALINEEFEKLPNLAKKKFKKGSRYIPIKIGTIELNVIKLSSFKRLFECFSIVNRQIYY